MAGTIDNIPNLDHLYILEVENGETYSLDDVLVHLQLDSTGSNLSIHCIPPPSVSNQGCSPQPNNEQYPQHIVPQPIDPDNKGVQKKQFILHYPSKVATGAPIGYNTKTGSTLCWDMSYSAWMKDWKRRKFDSPFAPFKSELDWELTHPMVQIKMP